MFNSMEKILRKNKNVIILEGHFYCKGASKMAKGGEEKEPIGHPKEEDLTNSKAFGEKLRTI